MEDLIYNGLMAMYKLAELAVNKPILTVILVVAVAYAVATVIKAIKRF